MEKRLLITGFDPFGGETVNPAWEAVCRLPDRVEGWALARLQVPTVFGKAAEAVLAAAADVRPCALLCVGQAAGRARITPEKVAINLRCARIPDNQGNRPQNAPAVPGSPAAYFSTLPAEAMARAVADAGVPGAVSYSAGVFVCNDLFYSLLHHYHQTDVRVGFVHVPCLPEQAGAGEPCLPLARIVQGLTAAIGALDAGNS